MEVTALRVQLIETQMRLLEAQMMVLQFQHKEAKQEQQMAEYENLLACYRSGQIPEAAWTEHLQDKAFAAFVAQQRA